MKNLQSNERYANLRQYADKHGIGLREVANAGERGLSMSMDAAEAKKFGLVDVKGHGRAGEYRMALDGKGGEVFTDGKSGVQYAKLNKDDKTYSRMDTSEAGKKAWQGASAVNEDTKKSVHDHQDSTKDGQRTEYADSHSVDTAQGHAGAYTAALGGGEQLKARLAPLLGAVATGKGKEIREQAWALSRQLAAEDPLSKSRNADVAHKTSDDHKRSVSNTAQMEEEVKLIVCTCALRL